MANASVKVSAPAERPQAGKAQLPLIIYDEGAGPSGYQSSGWMGNAEAIRLDPGHAANPRSGSASLRCEFAATEGWGGVVWQSPANDWGDRPGGYDLTGAKTLTFWARGEKGGEGDHPRTFASTRLTLEIEQEYMRSKAAAPGKAQKTLEGGRRPGQSGQPRVISTLPEQAT